METSLSNLVNKLFKKDAGIEGHLTPTDMPNNSKTFGTCTENIKEAVNYSFKYPKKSLSFLLSELKDKYVAVGNLVASNVADVITTLMVVNKYDLSVEASAIPSLMMESLGSTEGLLILKGVGVPLAVGALYFAGQRSKNIYEKKKRSRGEPINKKFSRLRENAPFYLASAAFYGIAANNLYQFLKF